MRVSCWLDSLLKLIRWLEIGTILRSRWCYELASLLIHGKAQDLSQGCYSLLCGNLNQSSVCSEFSGQMGPLVLLSA